MGACDWSLSPCSPHSTGPSNAPRPAEESEGDGSEEEEDEEGDLSESDDSEFSE